MKIIIENVDLVLVHNACHNALRSSNGIQGRTRMTLDSIIDAIKSKRESFQRHWKEEVEKHVIHENGEPLQVGGQYVFKSDAHEEEYMNFIELEHVIDLDLLIEADLMNIITTRDQLASADDHYRSLKLVTEGFAKVPETNNDNQNEEEE